MRSVLHVQGGANPLDASAVHPESYPVVERILAEVGRTLPEVIGNGALLRKLAPARFADERFGEPTVRDVLAELEKPGRDPRPTFRTADFREGVEDLKDLVPGMVLEGVVTNVTAFGAFVDVGVHQDGLVHISALSSSYVKDPHAVVKAGAVVTVKVMEVDLARKRIALSNNYAGNSWRQAMLRSWDKVTKPAVEAAAWSPTRTVVMPSSAAGARLRSLSSKKAEVRGVTSWRRIIRLKVSACGLGM